jgi:hypothetical protein
MYSYVDPYRLRQVIIVRIWLDFYEDNMLPCVLSSIHIQGCNIIITLHYKRQATDCSYFHCQKFCCEPREIFITLFI